MIPGRIVYLSLGRKHIVGIVLCNFAEDELILNSWYLESVSLKIDKRNEKIASS